MLSPRNPDVTGHGGRGGADPVGRIRKNKYKQRAARGLHFELALKNPEMERRFGG